MSVYSTLLEELAAAPRTWLVTGVAGFIGSNLLEVLLRTDQQVIGLDNFSTGKRRNLSEVLNSVTPAQQARFSLITGDVRSLDVDRRACRGVDYVLHQAALGSVPRSIADPLASHDTNVNGFLNLLVAAREQKIRRLVYASSSSVYGDDPELPKVEARKGQPLSPYGVTKLVSELYAQVFARTYGIECIGLRYFNVFGPRQDPGGPYAAVIPRWIVAMTRDQPARIYGDGSTSRDFCYVANAVQANLLAATTRNPGAVNQVFNVALGARTTLNELFEMIRLRLAPNYPHLRDYRPVYEGFRTGDIRASQAAIDRARQELGYAPTHTLAHGLDLLLAWARTSRKGLVPEPAASQLAEALA